LPSLVCVVVVSTLSWVVLFVLSQPKVNAPSVAITTHARKRFILIPFLINGGWLSTNRNRSCQRLFPLDYERLLSPRIKKADVAEHPKAFDHVGLLFNEPSGRAGLFFS
jgi:hypothetical protein